ncbi:MAG: YebC/PmpR family DNA-binding transcriptional regulator [Bacteroidales bacterium]|jgi:YebC/PmpR family DNA-binding regulatory protein|nr:YebC/PmpR family DNA-binding transcriptional regulator [Bacteroidales bacterium]
MGRAFEYRKARKLKRWGNMSRMFTKYGREISIAVKEGGPNPEYNSHLRAIIQNAKSDNMPKENIDRAIKKATEKDTADFKEVSFEGYAPHGIAVYVHCATDNNTRTVANVRSYFNKYNGSLGVNGSVSFMFDKKCMFVIPDVEQDLEELELELIDYGAEEVFKNEDGVQIYGDFSNFGSLQKILEEKGFDILKADYDYLPNVELKSLNEEEQADVEKLIEKIEEDDDVVRVFTTMA